LGALSRALVTQARKVDADLLVWKDFPASFRAEPHFFPVVSFPGTVAPLGGSKEAYFTALKGTRRHVLRKKLRRSAARVDIRTDVVQSPDAATLDAVFALFWQTYEKAKMKFERLNRRFFDVIAAAPVSHFILLREAASGELVAFMLCFDLGTKVINKFIGIDHRRPREWLLYFRLWEAALDWALARGAAEIQSGQTDYAPKIEVGHRLVPLTNYCAHRSRLVHTIARYCARQIDWTTLDDDLARFLRAHPGADW
jgi:predicted N-acyltransferase